MKEAILKLQNYKRDLQHLINVSLENEKTLRASIYQSEMIGLVKSIEILKQ